MLVEALTTTLYRPIGSAELALIAGSGYRRFPPRLPEQPIFYPVLNEPYASQIARDWNAQQNPDGLGFVTRLRVRASYLQKLPVQVVGSHVHEELWVPAQDLPEFNDNIVGLIEVIATYRRPTAAT